MRESRSSAGHVELDVLIPLRDGTPTRADRWSPADGGPTPAVLIRTPYSKSRIDHYSPVSPALAISRGFGLVIQDVRGRHASKGAFDPFRQELEDGEDTVAWVAAQPWCDGHVFMTGWSYVGAASWLAGRTAPPALRAIAPINSSPYFGEGWFYRSGALEIGFLASWIAESLLDETSLWRDRPDTAVARLADLIADFPAAAGWVATPGEDPKWEQLRADRTAVPAMIVGGWFDIFLGGTLRAYRERSREDDRLLIGPWGHDNLLGQLNGMRNHGSAGNGLARGLGSAILDFFDSAHPDRPSAPAAPVEFYVLGGRRWEQGRSWPPRAATRRRLDLSVEDLRPAGAVLPGTGARGLYLGVPGGGFGSVDLGHALERDDTLVFELSLGTEPCSLVGPVNAELEIEPGGVERQLIALLGIRGLDGVSALAEGIAFIAAGDERTSIDLLDVCIEVAPQESLVLVLCVGLFPRWPTPGPDECRLRAGSALVVTCAMPRGDHDDEAAEAAAEITQELIEGVSNVT